MYVWPCSLFEYLFIYLWPFVFISWLGHTYKSKVNLGGILIPSDTLNNQVGVFQLENGQNCSPFTLLQKK